MNIYNVCYEALASGGNDIVVCEDTGEIISCLEERGHKGVEISQCIKINIQQVRVKDLTAGDLIKLINNK